MRISLTNVSGKNKQQDSLEGRENTSKGGLNWVYRKHSPLEILVTQMMKAIRTLKSKGHKIFIQVHLNKVNPVHPPKDDFAFNKDLIHYNQTDYNCTRNRQ